jgi:hypothetical protein
MEASAAQMDAWVVFKDGSGGRRVPKSSLVRKRFVRKARQAIALAVFKACTLYRGATLVGLESAAGSKLEKMVCKGDPLPTLVDGIPCNVSADSPTAACITFELPGSLLKLICDVGVSAINILLRVALSTVSKLAATAELYCRRVE